MKQKIILDEKVICEEYTTTNIGIEALALKNHAGKKKIKEILVKNGIVLKKRGAQSSNEKFVTKWKENKYKEVNGSHYVVYDPQTLFTSTDIQNKSGALTTYIEKTYGIKTPTLYDRRKYYMKSGNYWWEQWLKVRLEKNKPIKKCPYCEWVTIDVNNKSGAFEQHLINIHNKTKIDYLNEFPEERNYFIASNPQVNLQIETNTNEFVTCKVCGKKLRRIDSHHLKKHGLTKTEYVMKYGKSNLSSLTYINKQRNIISKVNENLTFTKQSKAEKEIISMLEENGIKCKPNRKILKGQEIDIFIPDLNIGIEYDGLFYHTEQMGKDKYYHLNKTTNCLANGVKLFHIFEDEYIKKHNIVMSKIMHLVGKNNNPKIYARNCVVKPISYEQSVEFLEKNHIQGKGNYTIALGLFYKDNIVAVMLFLYDKNDMWNLTRFAADINLHCIGAGGKLFKYFIKTYNPKQIKTFADRRWTADENNNLYTRLGFTIDSILKPDYRYYNKKIDKYNRIHKFNFRKQVLHKKYGFPLTMTELEMTRELGYDRIWDCGLIKYVYYNKNKP